MSLSIQKYTDKCIVVRGDTKPRKEEIKAIGGACFGYYGNVPGWMFPLAMEDKVRKALGIGPGYISGPTSSAGKSGQRPYQAKSSQGITPDMLMRPAAGVVQSTKRGVLRGPPIEDPDDEEQPDDQQGDDKSTGAVQIPAGFQLVSSTELKQLIDRLSVLDNIVERLANVEVAIAGSLLETVDKRDN